MAEMAISCSPPPPFPLSSAEGPPATTGLAFSLTIGGPAGGGTPDVDADAPVGG